MNAAEIPNTRGADVPRSMAVPDREMIENDVGNGTANPGTCASVRFEAKPYIRGRCMEDS